MFLTVWLVFLIMSIKKIKEPIIDNNFMEIIKELVLYLTIFVTVGINGIEVLSQAYQKVTIKKINKQNNINNSIKNDDNIKRG